MDCNEVTHRRVKKDRRILAFVGSGTLVPYHELIRAAGMDHQANSVRLSADDPIPAGTIVVIEPSEQGAEGAPTRAEKTILGRCLTCCLTFHQVSQISKAGYLTPALRSKVSLIVYHGAADNAPVAKKVIGILFDHLDPEHVIYDHEAGQLTDTIERMLQLI